MAGSKKGAAGRAYITGANGRLGKAVLSKTGAIPLVRRPCGLPGEIVTDFSRGQLSKILSDAQAIVHAAGSSDTLNREGMHQANVILTRNIVESAPQGCRIIFAGSISVYGKRLAGIPADEGTPPAPDSDYSKGKYEAERIVLSRPESVVFRIAPLYGPQYGDYFRVLSLIERGKMRIIGDGANRVPFVHVDDAADMFRKALACGSGTYVLSGEPVSQKEIYSIAASELSVEPPRKRVPRSLAMLAAAIGELRFRLGGKRPGFTREHVAVLSFDRAFDCARAKKELGFSPRPIDRGIREMVRAYKAAKGEPGAQ
jgi:nucleoside-diphosphate-sugar epimerase